MNDHKQEAIKILNDWKSDIYSHGFFDGGDNLSPVGPLPTNTWEIYARLASLMQDEYSLPKCLKCGVVINSIKQDNSCEHQYTDRRSGEERRERKNRRNPAGEYYDMDRRIATSGLPYPNRQTDRRTLPDRRK